MRKYLELAGFTVVTLAFGYLMGYLHSAVIYAIYYEGMVEATVARMVQ